jgi:putative spermidine/putrescine transport system ATP-binding protein
MSYPHFGVAAATIFHSMWVTKMNAKSNAGLGKNSVVEFKNTSKTYDGKHNVVERLNVTVKNGEFLTILGPSGSGKTTALMMLAGFEDPTEGDILLNGRSLRRIPPFRRNIGVVFQSYALFPHKTVGENIAFPLIRRKLPRSIISEKVSSILKLVELDGLDTRSPNQLSGGQQQRVALARALVFEPSLVLMDEPLGSLDRKLREQMQFEIKRLHRTCGMTFMYVTHDQGEALTMSDRIAILHEGIVQQTGTPKEIYERPANLFAAQFIGENNVLSGSVQRVNGKTCTVLLDTGQVIMAQRNGVDGASSRAFVCVRPEGIAIDGGNGSHVNSLSGTVAELIYSGDHTRVCVDVPGQGTIIVKTMHHTNVPQARPGSEVELKWQSQCCTVLEAPPVSSVLTHPLTTETNGRAKSFSALDSSNALAG